MEAAGILSEVVILAAIITAVLVRSSNTRHIS